MPLPNEMGEEQGGSAPMDMGAIKQQIAGLQQGISALVDAVGGVDDSPEELLPEEGEEPEAMESEAGNEPMDALSKFHKQGAMRRM